MDGVLVDNMRTHTEAFAILCRRYGIAERSSIFKEHIGMGNDDIMRALFPPELLAERGWEALSDEKEAIYRDLIAASIRPVEGLIPFLQQLRDAGIRCAVGSSACRANVEFVFERCGLTPYFAAAVSGDEVVLRKPDPEIYLTAARALRLPPENCVVFEDARAGIEAGRRAGMKVVAVATSLPHEELERTTAAQVIDDFTQIDARRLAAL